MSKKIQSVQGMNDILPIEQKDFKIAMPHWQAFENIIQSWTKRFAYHQIRTPIVEQTDLFARSIGEETDVVGKEMYTFTDGKDGLSLTLRPEGTASCLRAVVEHNLLRNHSPQQKLWYMGAMFRRERPQKGRYRQFHQVGVEALGFKDADIDAELVAMCADLWQELGISQYLTLEINSLGNREERQAHRQALVAYLEQHRAILDEDSLRRMHSNPLRVLDTKNPQLQNMANNAPRLIDYLQADSLAHYEKFKNLLRGLGIDFLENPRLVRGLDYYNHTVFEWTTDKLGAQATVCGGGRYDGLIAQLGERDVPSIGFAMGVERLLLLVREWGILAVDEAPEVFVMQFGEGADLQAMKYALQLRQQGWRVWQHCGVSKLQNQMKRADGSGAKFALIIAEDELKNQSITLKDLRGDLGQITVSANDLLKQLNDWRQ